MKEDKKIVKKSKEHNTGVFAGIITGVSIGYGITAAVFIVYAIILTYTNATEQSTSAVVIATTILSVLVAGFIAAKAAESKGWLFGMMSGLLYATIMIMLGFIISPEIRLGAKTVMILALSVAGGGLGGIIGINIKK